MMLLGSRRRSPSLFNRMAAGGDHNGALAAGMFTMISPTRWNMASFKIVSRER
jgi:hypothetical protein